MKRLFLLLALTGCIDKTTVRVDGQCGVDVNTDRERVIVKVQAVIVPVMMPMPVKVAVPAEAPL